MLDVLFGLFFALIWCLFLSFIKDTVMKRERKREKDCNQYKESEDVHLEQRDTERVNKKRKSCELKTYLRSRSTNLLALHSAQ